MGTPPTTIEQLKLLLETERIAALLARQEDQWFDLKSPRTQARALGDTMIGFANAEGGLITLGIQDGTVEGVARSGRVNDWRQAALDHTSPPVRHRFETVPCINDRGHPDEVVLIEVEPSERVHENRKGEVFLRVGDENRRLGLLEAQELHYDKSDSIYDATAAGGVQIEDLMVRSLR